jgi:hypothetical protein
LKNQDKFEKEIKVQFDNFEPKPNEGLWDNIAQNIPSDNFEKNIAQKLTTLQFEPSKGIWLAIEKRLPQIVRFNKKLIYLWTVVVLFIGVIAGIFINKFTTETAKNSKLTHPKAFVWLENNKKLAPETSEGNKQLAIINEQTISNNQSLSSNYKINNAKASLERQAIIADKNSKKLLVENTIVEKINGGNHHQNNNLKVIIEKPLMNNKEIENKQVAIDSQKPENKTTENKVNIDQPNTKNQLPIVLKEPEVIPLIEENKKPEENQQQQVSLTPLTETKQPIATEADYKGATLKKEKLTIIAYAGVGYSYMNYSGDNYKTNIKLRENTEKPEINITGGFVFGYDITKRITLSSGLILSNFKQTLSYNKELAKTPSGNYEENLVFYNDTISVGNNNSSSLNYSFTEIPFFVTYKIFENKKIELALQSGLGIGFLTGINTFIINENNIGIYAISNKNDFPNFRNTVFFSFQPQLNYSLNTPGVSVGLMPIIKTSIFSIVDNENWIKQYPYNLSMNLFLRKRF